MPAEEAPRTEEQYIEWARKDLGVEFDEATKRLYSTNALLALVAHFHRRFIAPWFIGSRMPDAEEKIDTNFLGYLALVTFVVTLRRQQCCRVWLWQKGQ